MLLSGTEDEVVSEWNWDRLFSVVDEEDQVADGDIIASFPCITIEENDKKEVDIYKLYKKAIKDWGGAIAETNKKGNSTQPRWDDLNVGDRIETVVVTRVVRGESK